MIPFRSVVALTALTLLLATPAALRASPEPRRPGSSARPLAPASPSGPSSPAEAIAPSLSYQGYLSDALGTPLSGSHDLTFQLWDAATGGGQVGPDVAKPQTQFQAGLFTVEIPVDPDAFDGRGLWLRVAADGTWLSPRQALLPVPYAMTLRPGARIAGSVAQPTLRIGNDHPSGTAIEAGGSILGVDATGQTALRAAGMAVGVDARGMTGVLAEGDVGVSGSGIVGVRGSSESGTGLEGGSDSGEGVLGESTSGYGVHGKSQLKDGVFGETAGGFSAGVAGSGPTGVFGSGGVVGVAGYTESEGAAAVRGTSKGPKGEGVSGTADGYDGVGVSASAPLGTGVVASGEVGIKGTGLVNTGVIGEGVVGVAGSSASGDGVTGTSGGPDTAAAVRGMATGLATGGHFTSSSGTGLQAFGYEGVHAEATTGAGYGVHGQGRTGVHGEGVFGVGGTGTTVGVVGSSTTGIGVQATAGGTGAEAAALRVNNTNASHGMAAYLTNASDYANTHISNSGGGEVLLLQSTGGTFLRAVSTPWDEKFRFQYDGHAYADGSWHSGGADFAELLPATDGLEAGDVLVIDAVGRLTRSTGRYMTTVAGVYSSEPGFVGGSRADGSGAGGVPLAIVGVVPVRASAENGAIRPGDLLATAATPGHAMRAGQAPPQGTVIGKALAPLAAGTGMLRMLVSLQ